MSARRRDAAGLGSADIANEILRSRVRISRNLAVLDREYGARHVFVRGVRAVYRGDLASGGLKETLRRNALPLAVAAAGLGWIAAAGRGSGQILRQIAAALAQARAALDAVGVMASPHSDPPPQGERENDALSSSPLEGEDREGG